MRRRNNSSNETERTPFGDRRSNSNREESAIRHEHKQVSFDNDPVRAIHTMRRRTINHHELWYSNHELQDFRAHLAAHQKAYARHMKVQRMKNHLEIAWRKVTAGTATAIAVESLNQ